VTSIKLVYTDNIGGDVAASFETVARRHLPIEGPSRYYIRLSALELPAVIQLIGSVAGWLTLAMATGYFGQLGVKAADFTLEKAKYAFKRNKTDPLTEMALAISKTKHALGDNSHFIIGLDIPDNRFGTSLTIQHSDPEKIAYEVGNFLLKAEQIARFMEREIATGQGPLGRVAINFQADGTVQLQWMRQSDMAAIEQTL
jgi:hypothetical protein